MTTNNPPSGPVDTVKSMSILGAKVMHGTWPNGETAILIGEAMPYDPIDAQLSVQAGEL